MGFLSGAYGKLMAGKYLRTLQAKETRLNAQLHSVTRQSAQYQKMITAQQRGMTNQIRNASMQELAPLLETMQGINPKTNKDEYTAAQQAYVSAQMNMQTTMSLQQSQIEAYFEMLSELYVEPLKDQEEEINTELDSLKSQITLAQAQYEAKQKEEQDGAKSIAPDYTGQG